MGDSQMLRDLTYTVLRRRPDRPVALREVRHPAARRGRRGRRMGRPQGLIDIGERTLLLDQARPDHGDVRRPGPQPAGRVVGRGGDQGRDAGLDGPHARGSGWPATMRGRRAPRSRSTTRSPGRVTAAGAKLRPVRTASAAAAAPPARTRTGTRCLPSWRRPQPRRRTAPAPIGAGQPVDLPLDGVKAIDISQAVAGPTAARLLADFGADVIKIGSTVPGGHRRHRRAAAPGQADDPRQRQERGRRAADERPDPRGRRARHQLHPEVAGQVRHRLRPGPGAQPAPRATARSPRTASPGPWAHRRGYENQCNAATGMSWRYGSRFGWTLYQPTPINDAGTGILGAFAVGGRAVRAHRGGPARPGSGWRRRWPRGRPCTRPPTWRSRRSRAPATGRDAEAPRSSTD